MTHLTPQAAFDAAARGVIGQGRAASDDGKRCRLKTLSGAKCAVGWLIPDDRYRMFMESRPFMELLDILGDVIPRSLYPLLCDLQTAHDEAFRDTVRGGDFIEQFCRNMAGVARGYRLSARVLDETQPGAAA